jgi:hypothetical protein
MPSYSTRSAPRGRSRIAKVIAPSNKQTVISQNLFDRRGIFLRPEDQRAHAKASSKNGEQIASATSSENSSTNRHRAALWLLAPQREPSIHDFGPDLRGDAYGRCTCRERFPRIGRLCKSEFACRFSCDGDSNSIALTIESKEPSERGIREGETLLRWALVTPLDDIRHVQ